MNMLTKTSRGKQRGAAALVTVVVLIAVLMLTTITLSTTSSFEIREAADSTRQKEAFSAGQAGLDLASMKYLSDNTVSLGSGSLPSGTTYSYTVSLSSDSIDIDAVGVSADTGGEASISEKFGMASTLGFGDIVPFLAAASIPTGGSFGLVTNPNGGGDGVPVSAWVEGAGINGKASWQTCNQDEYLYQGASNCGAVDAEDMLCNSDSPEGACQDFVVETCVPDPVEILFPIDMPAHVSAADSSSCGSGPTSLPSSYHTYRDDHETDCSALNALGGSGLKKGPLEIPVAWVKEDCTITNTVGSADEPIIAVVEGDLELKDDFYGIVLMLSPGKYLDGSGNPLGDVYDFKINGNTAVYGAVMIMGNITHTNGTSDVIFDEDILDKLSGGGEGFSGIARIKGTWHDF